MTTASKIVFDEYEIKALQQAPEALRILAAYHDFQQDRADSTGMDCTGDERRAKELREEADRIEKEY